MGTATAADGVSDTTVDHVEEAFVRMFADPHVRATCEAFTAEVLERAASHGAARWVASLRGAARINVSAGRAYVLSLREETLRIPVDRSAMDADSVQALTALATLIDEEFKTVPGASTYEVPAVKLGAARELLLPGHAKFIERAAQTAKQTPYAFAHCPAIVDFLSSKVARQLAQPAYQAVTAPTPTARSWIFQANPKLYDLRGALSALKQLNWAVRQHTKKVRAGDTAYLWLSGDGGGLLARALVTTDPEVLPPRASEKEFRRSDEFDEDELSVVLDIEAVLKAPVTRDQLLSFLELEDLGFLQAAQGTNFPLEAKHAAILRDLSNGTRAARVVKIAPGEQAKYWDECRSGGYICVGWDEVGDLTQFASFSEFRKAFSTAHPSTPGHVTIKARELWTLRSLREGDYVVANRGTSEVLAVGRVTGGYAFREDRPKYRHTVSVEWDTSLAGSIPEQAVWAMRTVDPVSPELAEIIFRRTPTPASTTATRAQPYDALRSSFHKERLYFSDETLSHYLLALQTKRFVILTGISGTGKTQLALGVAKHFRPRLVKRVAAEVPEGVITIRVAPHMLKYRRFVMPVTLKEELFSEGKISELELRAGHQSWTCHVSQTHEDRVAMVHFRKELFQWFQATFAVGDLLHLRPSLEGKPRIELVQAKHTETTAELDNYEVIAVRPDWTDGRSLLGFYNPISRHYETTPFLRLVLRALDEVTRAKAENREPHPFFVVLDEMNLARVEHYFSDFLSAMESDEWCVLHDQDAIEEGEDPEEDAELLAIPKRFKIPPNLFVTGTVNVDETTHMFSPKVLDRAFVMELHDVDLQTHGAPAVVSDDLRLDRFGVLVSWEKPNTSDWNELGELHGGVLRDKLVALHERLAREHRHFGFRVANEIARFLELASEQASDDLETLVGALDLAVLSKVLPKLHGTTQELRQVLHELFAFTVGEGRPVETAAWMVRNGQLELVDGTEGPPDLPRSACKLWRMNRRLAARGFTSFIE
ncbi:MAG: EVE domain-containing protein [Kofleriaceae bacterium]|nr:EVE domain-containing protein [Kofleriaceae bacterium]MCL4224001.1 EVE domain-containing protein [Myxococcales bacterium]